MTIGPTMLFFKRSRLTRFKMVCAASRSRAHQSWQRFPVPYFPIPSLIYPEFRFQIRFRVYNDLKIESDSETVMSPEPRVSVFRFLDERLRKFWSMGSLKVAWYAEIHPLNAGASAGKPEGPRNAI